MCLSFSRIVSESKTLVNGIDPCVEQILTPEQNKVGNNSYTEKSSTLRMPPVPMNSPAADSTELNDSGSSWFTSLTSVVDSPNSYPQWHDGDAVVSSLNSITSAESNSSHSSSSSSSSLLDPDVDDDDELEPPAKRQLLERTSGTATEDDDVSTTAAVVAPLLGQLLSSSVETSDQPSADDSVDGCPVDSVTCNTDSSVDVTSHTDVEDACDEGLLHVVNK